MEQPKVKQVSMLILRQPNIAAAVDFYQKLGLKLKFHLKDAWAEMVLGSIKIGLCPADVSAEHRTGIVFEVENLHAFYAAFQDTGIFIGEPKEAVHGIMVSFKDLGGNIIDLYQPTPERVVELVKNTARQPDVTNCCQKNEKNNKAIKTRQCCKSGISKA